MCSADFLRYDYIQMLSRLREADGTSLQKGRLGHVRVSTTTCEGKERHS
jgi:hypothetical protein